MENKVIITAAVTGSIHTPSMSEYLPITSQEIADDAIRAHEAGAAVCHIHARIPEPGEPSPALEIYEEIITRVKNKCNVVQCITTGGKLGTTPQQRLHPVSKFKPELASFNAGSINFAIFHSLDKFKSFKFDWEEKYLAMTEDHIFPNTFFSMKEFAKIFAENNTSPEFEVYDAAMINNIAFLIEKGYVKKPVYIQFVMGILGGITATAENLIFLVEYAKKLIGNFVFSVAAAGRAQFPLCTHSFLIGGNARVGLEDNLYLKKGVLAKSSAEQVEKMVRIIREFGFEPATPDEARKILGLKGKDKTSF
jgi:uncharacterized protein (DUF849 family)